MKDFEEWKPGFLDLQERVDIIILGVPGGIADWVDAEAEQFILDNVKVPTVVEHDWMINYGVLAFSKVAEEQGIWAAKTALDIIDGKNPAEIPVAKNREGKIALNFKLAEKLGITFGPDILKNAEVIYE